MHTSSRPHSTRQAADVVEDLLGTLDVDHGISLHFYVQDLVSAVASRSSILAAASR